MSRCPSNSSCPQKQAKVDAFCWGILIWEERLREVICLASSIVGCWTWICYGPFLAVEANCLSKMYFRCTSRCKTVSIIQCMVFGKLQPAIEIEIKNKIELQKVRETWVVLRLGWLFLIISWKCNLIMVLMNELWSDVFTDEDTGQKKKTVKVR